MTSRRHSQGLSLIELMIALLIGTILLLGVVQVFGASRTAYQLSEGMSRTQENARFALDYLQRDIRMAGHFGCVNDQARNQSAGGLVSHFTVNGPADFGFSVRGYDDATPPGIVLAPARVAGTDAIVLRYLGGDGVPVTAIDAAGRTIDINPARWASLTVAGTPDPVLFGVGDCAYADVFEATATSAAAGRVTAPATVDLGRYSASADGGPTMLYRAEALVYYIGLGAGGQPSLWRARINANGTTASEELVEGIENLQFRYGIDRNAAPALPSGYIATQGTATDVGATADRWLRIGQVQVGLLASSPNRAASVQASQITPMLLGEAQAPAADGRYRAVYESTIALRNRLYGN
ncbi:PilW family protein [Pseudoxanthomonas koreensis]|uniref:PilW family protein n=1 Tax=Pseudoxanthomonas koreensis TaxID=266061 RepID=UPI0013916046|nr:PilW family protein [Pseudoxanthomonas koreensis]KAF1691384.1 pilus assembly protein PilW [Pseudoxanthomonas koreensis]